MCNNCPKKKCSTSVDGKEIVQMKEITIGVLALQGAFAKHIEMIRSLGVQAREVRHASDLLACQGLILPGGESTTIMRLIKYARLEEPLRSFSAQKPVFGTCAGLIIMSKSIKNDQMIPFEWMDIEIERNAYGRQIDSFGVPLELNLASRPYKFQGVFIRAPSIRKTGTSVQILAKNNEEAVLVRQKQFLGATFHPELTDDNTIHAYFLKMIS